MAEEIYPAAQQVLIEQAGTITADQADSLGKLWNAEEDLEYPYQNGYLNYLEFPIPENGDLIAAWQRALNAAGEAGRADELDAAREAGRAAVEAIHHDKVVAERKSAAEEAVRSAVLAVGVRDLISDPDYQLLTGPWQQVLGAI